MFFNGLQVVITYLAGNNSSMKAINDTNSVPLSWVLIGAVMFSAGMYMLWKTRTPLPADWSADYTTEELMEGEQ